ncbi:MAG: hypothetical protein EA397_07845 [Deltaproteobacteria bacterium]|nr:MAG: hypothetical protein EA397_07845 [Deltaproteobacteria bacterium]
MILEASLAERWQAQLGPLRPLHFTDVDATLDLPGHVRAGSGLRRWGERVVIVQDDVNALAILDEQTGTVAPLLLPEGPNGGRRFSERRGNKADKMDLEACVVLPDGRLLAIGSGSTPAREHFVVVDADHRVTLFEGGPLFEHLRATPPFSGAELNVEGAAIVGARIYLFQRGNGAPVEGRAPTNAIGELDLGTLLRWLDGEGATPQLLSVRNVDLGVVDGVPFGFTDAAPLPDGRIVFLAGAEDSPDTYHDGEILGARVGLIDGEHVRVSDIRDAAGAVALLKLEGIDLVEHTPTGGFELLVVTDMDCPDTPASIATLRWEPR